MTALPSFVELMATLGLDNNTVSTDKRPQPTSFPHHSRSSSYSSTSSAGSRSSSNVTPSHSNIYTEPPPAIYISRHRNSSNASDRDGELEARRQRTRYSPYSPPISHARRGSMPVVPCDEEPHEQPSRAYSTSPSPLLKPRSVGRRSSALGLTSSSKRPEKLVLADPELMGNTPISTFVRRRTPQASPISPTFPHRSRRAASTSVPVSLPKLPTFIFPAPQYTPSSQSSDTEDDDMGLNTDDPVHLGPSREVYAVGALRSLRHSDSNIPIRRSPALEAHVGQPITPVA
ncbi:unnamed protein product [Somion occarium]|uniref:Uncharacterized protein n=1 Tax=Somion occarium TaxID=3059160 RepID=A0ABP1D516_9APHY